jgi:hypothetical protein
MEIFGKNMLDDPKMKTDFKQLIGQKPEKPFECVGSLDEVNAALQETIGQYQAKEMPLPKLLEAYENFSIAERYCIKELCDSYNEENYVPEQFARILKAVLEFAENE